MPFFFLSAILLLKQISWIFPPLGFQSWVRSKYLFYDDYFNIFLLEALKKNRGMKWSSTIHLENTFRAGAQGSQNMAKLSTVGRQDTSTKNPGSISRHQRAAPGSLANGLEGEYVWMVRGKHPAKGSCRQIAKTAPEQRPEICVLQWELCMRKDFCFRPTKNVGEVI